MASVALRLSVIAEQREARHIMIEEYVFSPRDFIVAVLADDALFTFVWIVLGMTIVAVALQCNVENWLYVTVRTLDFLVRADKRVLGVNIVIKRDIYPLRADMAGVALVAKMTVMIVIFKVARHAHRFVVI